MFLKPEIFSPDCSPVFLAQRQAGEKSGLGSETFDRMKKG